MCESVSRKYKKEEIWMNKELLYFEVSPKIVAAGRKAKIRIRPMHGHSAFRPDMSYEVFHFPCQERRLPKENSRLRSEIRKGVMEVEAVFRGEQEHVILVESVKDGKRATVGDFRLYSLEKDLFGLRPYKGDFHIHSCHSDGVESPAYVAASSRKIGLDFMAVTDHRKMPPSVEAINTFKELDLDMALFQGEEVHPPGNSVHMINYGGRTSINSLFSDEARYVAEVEKTLRRLKLNPESPDDRDFASCVWCFDMIRKAGGLGIFCHPYWFCSNCYDVSESMTTRILDARPFDALELIGGYHKHEMFSNLLMATRYYEELAKGRKIPVVGASDAHGCETGELFGWYYTVVLSKSNSLDDVIPAIKSLNSVAIQAVQGESMHAYGSFRLVKYVCFLLKEYFPVHDGICRQEGELMLRYAAGDGKAAKILSHLKGGVQNLMDRYWCGR